MKRFRVVLILAGGLALGNGLLGKDVIRGGDTEVIQIGQQELSQVVVQHPVRMGNSRGDRFHQRNVLSQYSVSRKSSGAAVKIVRSSNGQSKVPLRKFPVVKVTSSTAR